MKSKILLDTQALLWIRMDHPDLTTKAKKAYLSPANDLFVSIASFWEITIKKSLGKIQLDVPPGEFFSSTFALLGITLLPLNLDHLMKLESLALHHRDPFDRILIAQALHEKMRVLGGDSSFDEYGVRRIW